MKKINIILLVVAMCGLSCDKSKEVNLQNNQKTLVLGHRAAGNKYSNEIVGNSLEAVEFGYSHLDGIEVDLQMSKDSTIWIIHDNEIENCAHDTISVCFLTDDEINEINQCTEGTLITLEELFDYLSKVESKKFVSLDMKAVTNGSCFNDASVGNWMELIADNIIKLHNKYNPNCIVAVESWDFRFLILMEDKNSNIETYQLVWNSLDKEDIDNAYNRGIDGLSCNFDSGIRKYMVDVAEELNLKIQIWTPNSEEDIENAIFLNPFAIQTDNVKYFVLDEG